mmetsp:Transcript_34691/g.120968  ORF Transcript_34691/g.120968 Transcript_34691/m.120968 type:complete len:214 (-) Transcript_34691:396-1037(-)
MSDGRLRERVDEVVAPKARSRKRPGHVRHLLRPPRLRNRLLRQQRLLRGAPRPQPRRRLDRNRGEQLRRREPRCRKGPSRVGELLRLERRQHFRRRNGNGVEECRQIGVRFRRRRQRTAQFRGAVGHVREFARAPGVATVSDARRGVLQDLAGLGRVSAAAKPEAAEAVDRRRQVDVLRVREASGEFAPSGLPNRPSSSWPVVLFRPGAGSAR